MGGRKTMPKNPNEDLRRYWGIFGDARFTPADLWRWFRGAYYHAGGQDGWPRDDFLEWLALNRKSWIESAPGPRGGQGWRISADAVDVCRAEEVFIEHTREEALAAISGVSVRFGRLGIGQRLSHPRFWEIVLCFEPPIPIEGLNIDGVARHNATAPFSFRAFSNVSLCELQEQVDYAETHVSELVAKAIEYHNNCIHQLNGLLHHVK